jgi:hypothetical protein
VQQTANAGAVDAHATPFKFNTQLIERQIAGLLNALAHKRGVLGKLALAHPMALPARFERACLGLEQDQVVHKPRLNPEVSRGLAMAVAFLDKRNNTTTQFHRMRLAHRSSPSTTMNHQSNPTGIPNPVSCDTL